MDIADFKPIEDIVNTVVNPPIGWVTTRNRKIENVVPKQIAYWTLYYYTNIPLLDIGFYFGRGSYSNVSKAVADVNNRLETDYSFSLTIKKVMELVEGLGYVMINRNGRKQYSTKNTCRSFSGQFKKEKIPPKRNLHSDFNRVVKPEFSNLSELDIIPPKVISGKIIELYRQTSVKKAAIFEEGVIFAEDKIRERYKQLLDFYNSVPNTYFTLKADVL